jgi:serine O-acetyltransferase
VAFSFRAPRATHSFEAFVLQDIALFIVRLSGGFWAFRSRMTDPNRPRWLRLFMRRIYYVYLERYGAYIGHSSQFTSEPCFPHNLIGVFVAGSARIGKNCVIYQQVTIGANSIPHSKGVGTPVIGDNVYIGVGAKIIGAVKVGDNCRIGANCVVTSDVPPNSLVVLDAPRVVAREQQMDNRYFRWSPRGPEYFDEGRWVLEKDAAIIERLRGAF